MLEEQGQPCSSPFMLLINSEFFAAAYDNPTTLVELHAALSET
jgi:hypothetical protein